MQRVWRHDVPRCELFCVLRETLLNLSMRTPLVVAHKSVASRGLWIPLLYQGVSLGLLYKVRALRVWPLREALRQSCMLQKAFCKPHKSACKRECG